MENILKKFDELLAKWQSGPEPSAKSGHLAKPSQNTP
jgi:hypothetical protein